MIIVVANTDGCIFDTLCTNTCSSSSFAAITRDTPQIISSRYHIADIAKSVSRIAINVLRMFLVSHV
ncbi:hypothetical protein COCVIDRAFT_102064 [Bipolaris victoriae FI3]|uniref:Uncharacterized protein n=1 Tax=Bipolaris victoriae (strain FI3) TaxID=930091 RepID=W7EJC8_BIPV3|nr:hypothetical protein COCVIDRAFT_102064 [Bipolaris victoriae FI3]